MMEVRSGTLPRRLAVAAFRRPRTRPGARLMLAGARRLADFADWVQCRAEVAALELEELVGDDVRVS